MAGMIYTPMLYLIKKILKTLILVLLFCPISAASAEIELSAVPQLSVAGGLQIISSGDAGNYHRTRYDTSSSLAFESLALGYRWGRLGIEGRADNGPNRLYWTAFRFKSDLLTVTNYWNVRDFMFGPTYSFPNVGFFGTIFINTFGADLGYALLEGRTDIAHVSPLGFSTSYSQVATGFSGGVFYRFEQFLGKSWSINLETNYNFVFFPDVANLNVSGGSSRAHNVDGSDLVINSSGLGFSLGLTYCFGRYWEWAKGANKDN